MPVPKVELLSKRLSKLPLPPVSALLLSILLLVLVGLLLLFLWRLLALLDHGCHVAQRCLQV